MLDQLYGYVIKIVDKSQWAEHVESSISIVGNDECRGFLAIRGNNDSRPINGVRRGKHPRPAENSISRFDLIGVLSRLKSVFCTFPLVAELLR